MAKRKRLTPAQNVQPLGEVPNASAPRGPLMTSRPPIADVAHDAASSGALQKLSDAVNEAREDGRIIQQIPLEQIAEDHLVRDRLASALDHDDMQALIYSIRKRGQQVAVEVSELEDGTFGLISGWRRVSALRAIAKENPELDTVLAIVRRPKDSKRAYRAMVEENEIRVGVSFYERARIVVKSVEAGVFRTERVALSKLFEAVTKSKRSKINGFIPIVHALDDAIPYPAALSEKQGLALSKALVADVGFASDLRTVFLAEPPNDAVAQTQMIAKMLSGGGPKPASTPKSEDVHYIRDGLTMRVHKGGKVTLEGERMTEPHFVKRLKEVLDNL